MPFNVPEPTMASARRNKPSSEFSLLLMFFYKPILTILATALKEIRYYQKRANLMLLQVAFARIVREICQDLHKELRFQRTAINALQEATEAYLVGVFEGIILLALSLSNIAILTSLGSLLCCIHAKRVTLIASDMQLVRALTKDNQYRGYVSK